MLDQTLSIGQCASLALILEATAPKPGNVHRGADFENLSYVDFVATAVAIGPAMERAAAGAPLGEVVLSAIQAMRTAVATNTSLGTVLLLAPLAKAARELPLQAAIQTVLDELSPADARRVYEAIRVAQPGGMGKVDEADIENEPPADLIYAMRLAADRDLVARQYANGFQQVLTEIVPWLSEGIARRWPLAETIAYAQLQLMARYPDSLIARKCGVELAEQAAARADKVLGSGEPGDESYRQAILDLDFWLRADHHRRNPGTSADLLAAGLFIALRDGIIQLPLRFY